MVLRPGLFILLLTGAINSVMTGSPQYPPAIQWLVKCSPPSITLGRQRLGFGVTDAAIRGAIDYIQTGTVEIAYIIKKSFLLGGKFSNKRWRLGWSISIYEPGYVRGEIEE